MFVIRNIWLLYEQPPDWLESIETESQITVVFVIEVWLSFSSVLFHQHVVFIKSRLERGHF